MKEKTIEIQINSVAFDKCEISNNELLRGFAPEQKDGYFLFAFPLSPDEVKEIQVLFDDGSINSGLDIKFNLKPELEAVGMRALSLDAVVIGKQISGKNEAMCYIYVPDDLQKEALEYAREHYTEIPNVKH